MRFSNSLAAFVLINLVFLTVVPASAGPGVSGGGNAVVCFDDPSIPREIGDPKNSEKGQILDAYLSHITSVKTYDLFEAEMPSGLESVAPKLMQLAQGMKTRDYSELVAQRFEKYVPGISGVIRMGASNFPDQQILMRPTSLHRIFDEADVGDIDTTNCVIATMAAQFKSGKQFFLQIDQRLFNHPQHSDLSKAVLFLHEGLYSTVHYGEGDCSNDDNSYCWPAQTNSRNTRSLLRELISIETGVTANSYSASFNSLGFHSETPECSLGSAFMGNSITSIADLPALTGNSDYAFNYPNFSCETELAQFTMLAAGKIIQSAVQKTQKSSDQNERSLKQWSEIAQTAGLITLNKMKHDINTLTQFPASDRALIVKALKRLAQGLSADYRQYDLELSGQYPRNEIVIGENVSTANFLKPLQGIDPVVP